MEILLFTTSCWQKLLVDDDNERERESRDDVEEEGVKKDFVPFSNGSMRLLVVAENRCNAHLAEHRDVTNRTPHPFLNHPLCLWTPSSGVCLFPVAAALARCTNQPNLPVRP